MPQIVTSLVCSLCSCKTLAEVQILLAEKRSIVADRIDAVGY